MVETIEAVLDGKVMRPENPLALEPNTASGLRLKPSNPLLVNLRRSWTLPSL